MIPGWEKRVAWSKANRWEDNEITQRLLRVVDEDFAVMIWDQFREHSFDWLYGNDKKRSYSILNKIMAIFKRTKYVCPMEKMKTVEGRKEVAVSLCNPWSN
jgi:hypothetical protein